LKKRYLIGTIQSLFLLVLIGATHASSGRNSSFLTDYYPERDQTTISWKAESALQASSSLTKTTFLPTIHRSLDLIYSDDFSDSNSGWPVGDDGVVKTRYVENEYEILLRNPSMWSGALAPFYGVSDYILEAQLRRHSGTTSDLGLIFDFKNWSNFYVFAIDPGEPEPWYGLVKIADGNLERLIPETTTPYINPGNGENTLRIRREAERIDLYINGHQIASRKCS